MKTSQKSPYAALRFMLRRDDTAYIVDVINYFT